jgi:hypothetical protein
MPTPTSIKPSVSRSLDCSSNHLHHLHRHRQHNKSSRRGATDNVDGRIVTGIVGNVGSRSDGGGGDVNADARGRTRSCLQ